MDSGHQPREFRVEYGPLNYPEEGFSIVNKGDHLIYTIGYQEELCCPNPSQWNSFWQELDELGVWDWNLHYDLCCLDGTRWRVKIVYRDLELESSGENDYPDNFLEFWEALEELLNRDLKLNI